MVFTLLILGGLGVGGAILWIQVINPMLQAPTKPPTNGTGTSGTGTTGTGTTGTGTGTGTSTPPPVDLSKMYEGRFVTDGSVVYLVSGGRRIPVDKNDCPRQATAVLLTNLEINSIVRESDTSSVASVSSFPQFCGPLTADDVSEKYRGKFVSFDGSVFLISGGKRHKVMETWYCPLMDPAKVMILDPQDAPTFPDIQTPASLYTFTQECGSAFDIANVAFVNYMRKWALGALQVKHDQQLAHFKNVGLSASLQSQLTTRYTQARLKISDGKSVQAFRDALDEFYKWRTQQLLAQANALPIVGAAEAKWKQDLLGWAGTGKELGESLDAFVTEARLLAVESKPATKIT